MFRGRHNGEKNSQTKKEQIGRELEQHSREYEFEESSHDIDMVEEETNLEENNIS